MHHTKTILICDDEAPLRELVRAVIGEEHRFVEAEDGDACVRLARELRPSLVVLDLMLPGRSGREVLAEIRADAEIGDTPVVVVTAWSHMRDDAVSAGADAFVGKPFDTDELRRAVAALLDAP